MSYLSPKLAHDKYFFELIHFPIIANIEPAFNPVFKVPLYIYGEMSASSEMMVF